MWRVLVVDDDPMITKAVVRLLRGRASVTRACSPIGAVLSMGVCPPFDAVWSDHRMPWPGAGAEVLHVAAELLPGATLWLVTADRSCAPEAFPAGTRIYSKPDIAAAAHDLCESLRHAPLAKRPA